MNARFAKIRFPAYADLRGERERESWPKTVARLDAAKSRHAVELAWRRKKLR
jgi:hypothetical protein